MTCDEMLKQMSLMDNGERQKFLEYLFENHFNINPLTREEMTIISDLRDGYVRVVENE